MNKRYKNNSKENNELSTVEEKSLVSSEEYYHDITVPEKKDEEERYYEIFNEEKPKKLGWSLASAVCAAVSVFLCYFGIVGLAVGLIAIALAIISRISLKYFDNLSIIGLIVGIFGAVFGAAFVIWSLVSGSGLFF